MRYWWIRRKNAVILERNRLKEAHRSIRMLCDVFNGKQGSRIKMELISIHNDLNAAQGQGHETSENIHGVLTRVLAGIKHISHQQTSLVTTIANTSEPQTRESNPAGHAEESFASGTSSPSAAANLSIWVSYRNGSCKRSCVCSCHRVNTTQSRWSTSRLLRKYVGFFFASYTGLPTWAPPCDMVGCTRLESETYKFRYEFPQWLLDLFMHLTVQTHHKSLVPKFKLRLMQRAPLELDSLLASMILRNCDEAWRILIDNPEAAFSQHPDTGDTALHLVLAKSRYFDSCFVTLLIRSGCDVQQENDFGITSGSIIAATILLQQSATATSLAISKVFPIATLIDNLDLSHITKIILGVQQGDLQSALANLPPWNSLVSGLDATGSTPLHWAAKSNHKEAIGLLVRHAIDVNVPNIYGETALEASMSWIEPDTLRYLIEMGAHIRSQARNVFCIACKYDRDDLAQTLVEEYEVDPNEPDAPSLTPLMMGVLNNSFDAIEYLIDLGVNIHIRDTAGLTPLHYAVVFNLHQSFFSLLLAAGADYKESPSGLNILHCAAPWANEATMACLPHHGLASVDPEATVDGETAESLFLQRTYRSPQLDAAFYFLLESVEKATAEMRQALSKGMDVGGTSDDEDDVFHDASEQL
ncbi:ankyrin repeat-containing domain protein [Verticillium dahliae]|nr:ankyrin repeat-containing domain protein [Verticillium dahliae]